MDDDRLTRECIWRMGAGLIPEEAFVRVGVEGRLVSAAHWRLHGDLVQQLVFEPGAAPLTTEYRNPSGQIRFIAIHPLIGDGFAAVLHDRDGPARQAAIGCVSSSHQPNGGGPQRADAYHYEIERLAPARVETRAGVFETEAFALSWRKEWPDALLWVTPGPLPILVRLSWALLDAVYELDALDL
jgi:hypothetical protein